MNWIRNMKSVAYATMCIVGCALAALTTSAVLSHYVGMTPDSATAEDVTITNSAGVSYVVKSGDSAVIASTRHVTDNIPVGTACIPTHECEDWLKAKVGSESSVTIRDIAMAYEEHLVPPDMAVRDWCRMRQLLFLCLATNGSDRQLIRAALIHSRALEVTTDGHPLSGYMRSMYRHDKAGYESQWSDYMPQNDVQKVSDNELVNELTNYTGKLPAE